MDVPVWEYPMQGKLTFYFRVEQGKGGSESAGSARRADRQAAPDLLP